MLRRILATATAGCSIVALAACGGPSGVELSDNWAGAEAFALSRVDGLTTVVGIDPVHRTADPLAVVPTQADDDQVLSPRIVELANGRWIVTIPKTGGRPSRLYEIDIKGHALDAIGTIEAGRVLLPLGSKATAISTAGATGEALIYDPATWRPSRAIPLPISPSLAAGGDKGVCLIAESTVTTISSASAAKPETVKLPDLQSQAITCPAGKPIVAAGNNTDKSLDANSAKVETVNGVIVVTAAGRVDRVAADQDTITLATSTPGAVNLVTLDRHSGSPTKSTTVKGLAGVTSLRHSSHGWVLIDGDTAVVVNTQNGTSSSFRLPGQLLDAS